MDDDLLLLRDKFFKMQNENYLNILKKIEVYDLIIQVKNNIPQDIIKEKLYEELFKMENNLIKENKLKTEEIYITILFSSLIENTKNKSR